MKFKIFLTLAFGYAALPSAQAKMICTDSGNLDGSFFLDITDFERFSNDHSLKEKHTLYFKPFRSFESPLIELTCGAANGFIDGPQGVFACRSGNRIDEADRSIPGVVEAVVFLRGEQLMLEVSGIRSHSNASVPCKERD